MDDSSWILVGSTLILGLAAIFGPVIAEFVKRSLLSPRLSLSYEQRVPFYHKAMLRSEQNAEVQEPAWYFRCLLENSGRSQARRCEVVLEGLWLYDAAGKPVLHTDFSPQTLGIGSGVIDLNPYRRVYATLGHIASLAHQLREERVPALVDIPGHHDINDLRFVFNLTFYPFSQPSSLVSGTYAIKVSVYSENAPRMERYFRIAWSGQWQDTEAEMGREFVITPLDGMPT